MGVRTRQHGQHVFFTDAIGGMEKHGGMAEGVDGIKGEMAGAFQTGQVELKLILLKNPLRDFIGGYTEKQHPLLFILRKNMDAFSRFTEEPESLITGNHLP